MGKNHKKSSNGSSSTGSSSISSSKKKKKLNPKENECFTAEAIPVEVGDGYSQKVSLVRHFLRFVLPLVGIVIANYFTNFDTNNNFNNNDDAMVVSTPPSMTAKKTTTTTTSTEQYYPERKLKGDWVEDWMEAPEYVTHKNDEEEVTHVMTYPNGASCDEEGILVQVTPQLFDKRWYNDVGQVVSSLKQLPHNVSHIYEGPTKPGTHFVWPCVNLHTARSVPGLPTNVKLTPLSSVPNVFHISNFLSNQEMEDLIAYSTSQQNPYRMSRSTAGTHQSWDKQGGKENIISTRTSDNAFDIQTHNSLTIKKRAFQLLRLHVYDENMADGIQVLRYQPTQAYINHHDYFAAQQSTDFNWNPANGGSNRWATVFLYLSDVSQGGQTLFPHSNLVNNDNNMNQSPLPSRDELLQKLKELNVSPTSWEGQMVLDLCFEPNKLSVQPRKGDALLFYSQTPDGQLDQSSLHGACPVLGTDQQKWGANLWVWNACRYSLCNKDPQQPTHELHPAVKAPYDTLSF